MFCKKGVPRIFAKACNFIKKETLTQVFPCEFCEISKNAFSYRTPPVAASGLAYRYETIIEDFKQFQSFKFETSFLKNENLF